MADTAGHIAVAQQPEGSWTATVMPSAQGETTRSVTGWGTLTELEQAFPDHDLRWESSGAWGTFREKFGSPPQ